MPSVPLAARTAVLDFTAAQSRLPAAVHERIVDEVGATARRDGSVLTLPFTAPRFRRIRDEAEQRLRALLDLSCDYTVLFLQGGASAQFALVPLNLAGPQASADYVETGYWSRKAKDEAARALHVNLAASSADSGFDRVPDRASWRLASGAAYVHVTDNETAEGVEYAAAPRVPDAPLVSDMTSNFLTRALDASAYGLIYAGAQKNLGVAGLTVVLVRRDLLARAHGCVPAPFDYARQAAAQSMVNTPSTFAIYVAGLMFEWLLEQGGLAVMDARARRRSALLYALLDQSAGFYRCRVRPDARSRVNVCFDLRDAALTARLLRDAEEEGLSGLAGHSRVGGVRASLYNAVPLTDVEVLAEFLRDFRARFG